jgi:hypothetical protein
MSTIILRTTTSKMCQKVLTSCSILAWITQTRIRRIILNKIIQIYFYLKIYFKEYTNNVHSKGHCIARRIDRRSHILNEYRFLRFDMDCLNTDSVDYLRLIKSLSLLKFQILERKFHKQFEQ